MLPESKTGRVDYLRYREQRSLHRELTLECNAGDLDLLKNRELGMLAMEAELAGLREQMDFLAGEGFLTAEQIEAAENCIGWGNALLNLMPQEVR